MAETRRRRTDSQNRYRDRVSGETEEAFGLENVRGLERPMASGPGDIPIGKDELGNIIYRTLLGTTYTVRRATPEESETTRTKVENWMGEGMPLPSMEQVVDAAQALPGAIYESAQDTLEGTATLGEATGWAPAMQAASLPARVPAGALRTGGGRNTENPKYNPLFNKNLSLDSWIESKEASPAVKQAFKDFATYTLNDLSHLNDEEYTLLNKLADEYSYRFLGGEPLHTVSERGTEFYNPLRTTVENMDFGKQGLKGETIAAFLEKRAPKVRKSLLRSADSGRGIFKAGQRYTQEEALDILDENFGSVTARSIEPHYPDAQRMNFLENKELDYGELVINQDRTVNFKANSQHYDDNTLAHARFSVRDDGAGGEMLVVEELQSDLVQHGFDTDLKGAEGKTQYEAAKELVETGDYPEWFADLVRINSYGEEVSSEDLWRVVDGIDEYRGFPKMTRETLQQFPMRDENDYLREKINRFIRDDDPKLEELWGRSYENRVTRKAPKSLPPVDSTTEFVRPLIHALMVEAKNRGIDKVVIPNSDAFIEARKGQLGVDESDIASAKKAFKQTYDDAVDKVLKELDREMGVDVNIERTTLRGKADINDSPELGQLDHDLWVNYRLSSRQFENMTPEDFYNFVRERNSRRGTPTYRDETDAKWQEYTNRSIEIFNKYRDVGVSYPSRMITIGNIPKGKVRFAEGGLVEGQEMDTQMKFAFMADGGMIDDGATVEPTTGNEVPPGSLKEEVADTIDAKLSVGEYVVPADVVQYYGVAHFEKLRQKAKEGLAEMEANGRIGGDPSEDELPFSDEELMAEDYEEDGAQGFAAGGLAWNTPQMTGLTNTGTETVTYVGPDGSKMPILFINGQPIQQIPQGYVPESQAKQTQAAFKSIRPKSGNPGEGDAGALNTMQAKPIEEWGVEDFERYSNSQGVMDVVTKLPALLGPGGAIMGGLMNKAYQMQGQQALKEIDNRLAMTDLDDQSRQRLETVKQSLTSQSEEGGLMGGLFGGEGLLGGLTGGGGLMEKMFGGGIRTTSEAPASRTGRSPSGPRGSGMAQPGNSSSDDAPKSSPRPKANPTGSSTPAPSKAPKNSTPAQKEAYSSSGKNNSQQVSGDPRNFADGGFVKRRNK